MFFKFVRVLMFRFILFLIVILLANCTNNIYSGDGVILKREQYSVGSDKDLSPITNGLKNGAMVAGGAGGLIGGGVGAMLGSLSGHPRPLEGGLIGALGLGALFTVIGASTGATYGIFDVLLTPQEKDTWVYTVKSLKSSQIYITKPQVEKLNNNTTVKIFRSENKFIIKPLRK